MGLRLSGSWRLPAYLLAWLAFMCAGCDKAPTKPPSTPDIANATDPQWVFQATPRAKTAVVFVHGIFGDTLGTWTYANGETFFRLLKAQPGVGTQLDIFAFGFTSNMFKAGSFDVREAANKLHESLQYKGVLEYPTVIFVAHSMGGLVVLRNLLTHRETLQKVPLLVLYAAPQEGAQIAAIAQHVANNPALGNMVQADGNSFLQQLNDDWRSLPERPPVICAYEKLATNGIYIVPWSSATRFCDGATTGIDADHISIVKPDRVEHPSLVVLVNALNKYVVGKQLTAKLETPDFIRDGNSLVFLLSDRAGRRTARLVNAGGSKLTFTLAQLSDPHLFLWPDDTPREIPARQTQRLHVALGYGATRSEYRFVLQSDVSDDQTVIVRVQNPAALAKRQAEALSSVAAQVNAKFADPGTISRLKGGTRSEAEGEFVSAVRNAVAHESPELPEPVQWLLVASFFNASNWPRLAVPALRTAERLSPATARSSSAKWLAGAVSAQSGIPEVFLNAETPKVQLNEVPRAQGLGRIVDQDPGGPVAQLAANLQQVPALRTYGFSLEGDIWAARGNMQAAKAAYSSAASLDSSPSLNRRLGDLGSAHRTPGAFEKGGSQGSSPVRPDLRPNDTGAAKTPFRSEDFRNKGSGTDSAR